MNIARDVFTIVPAVLVTATVVLGIAAAVSLSSRTLTDRPWGGRGLVVGVGAVPVAVGSSLWMLAPVEGR